MARPKPDENEAGIMTMNIDIEGRECLHWKEGGLWVVVEFNQQLKDWLYLGVSPLKDEAIERARKVIQGHPKPIRRPLTHIGEWPPPYEIVLHHGNQAS